jgi:hypothetical protein
VGELQKLPSAPLFGCVWCRCGAPEAAWSLLSSCCGRKVGDPAKHNTRNSNDAVLTLQSVGNIQCFEEEYKFVLPTEGPVQKKNGHLLDGMAF